MSLRRKLMEPLAAVSKREEDVEDALFLRLQESRALAERQLRLHRTGGRQRIARHPVRPRLWSARVCLVGLG